MRLATPEDFFNGPIYTHYRHHSGYRKRAELLRHQPQPILIAGCGFGFLVVELLKLNIDAYGSDASRWAIGRRVSERVVYGDILQPLDHWPMIVTEDLLPHLTDEEARLAAENCRLASDNVLHLVTEQGQAASLNYHSLEDWAQLTRQLVISLEGM